MHAINRLIQTSTHVENRLLLYTDSVEQSPSREAEVLSGRQRIRLVLWNVKIHFRLVIMDPCIVDYSVEIPTRCGFVIEFIIPTFFLKAQHVSSGITLIIRSSKLYLQPLVCMPIWWPTVAKAEWEMDESISHSALATAGHHMGI